MSPLILLVVLPIDVREIEVDCLETNHVEGRFVQTCAWDRVNGEWVDRGYLVHTDSQQGGAHVYGDRFRVVVFRCNRWHVVTSRVHLHRVTDHDPEAAFRNAGGAFRPCW